MKNVTTRHLRLFGSLNQTKLTPDSVQWASLMFSTATQIFKELYLLEQVTRLELAKDLRLGKAAFYQLNYTCI